MRRLARRALDAFPFDARSRRALDETLLDWEAEANEAAAASPPRRGFVQLRACVSPLRALVLVTGREVVDLPKASFAARMFVAIAPVALYFSWPSGLVRYPESVPPRYWPELTAALMVSTITILIPLGLFLVAATWPRQRRLPIVGAILVAAVAGVALWLTTPSANGHYRTIVLELLTRDSLSPGDRALGLVDRGPVDAMLLVWDRLVHPRDRFPAGYPIRLWLTGVAVATTLWGLLGLVVGRARSRRRLLIWVIVVPMLYLGLGASLGMLQRSVPFLRSFASPLTLAVGLTVSAYTFVPLILIWIGGRTAAPRETAR